MNNLKEQCIILTKIFKEPTFALYNELLSYWSDINGMKELLIENTDLNDDKKYSMNEVLLSVRKLLWKEISLDEFNQKEETLLISIFLLKKNLINKAEFLALWNGFVSAGLLSNEQIPLYFYTYTTDKINNAPFDIWGNELLSWTAELGVPIPPLSTALSIYKELLNKNVNDRWERYLSIIEAIHIYSEYIHDTLEHSEDEDLFNLLPWLEVDEKEKVTEYLLDKALNALSKPLTLDNFEKGSIILKDMPFSVNVLKTRISELPAKPLTMDMLAKVPEDLVQVLAPKFSYTRPTRSPKIRIFFPGGPNIGHSSILIKTTQGLLLFDFGLSVVNNSIAKWTPLLQQLDAVFLSHAHLDHSGAIPFLLDNSKDLPWFALKSTKTLCSLLWQDTLNLLRNNMNIGVLKANKIISHIANKESLENALSHFHELKLGDTISILPDIEITTYEASHLFGSVGYEINIAGKRIFYTGDFNADGTSIFTGAKFPTDCDMTLFDGTYYARYNNYADSVAELTNLLKNSKRIIIPAFSMGRSQEMLFQVIKAGIDKNWRIYITGMGATIAQSLNVVKNVINNNKESKNIKFVPTIKEEDFTEKTLVIAGQGMLQAGVSRKLLDYSAKDPETSIALCSYLAPNTLGWHLLNKNPYLQQKYKQNIVKLAVSGHTTGNTLDKFIDNLAGKKVIVHAPEGSYEQRKRDDVLVPYDLEPFPL